MQCRETPTHLKRATSSLSALQRPPPTFASTSRHQPTSTINRSQSFADFGGFAARRKKMGSSTSEWDRPVLGDLLRSPKLSGRKANVTLGGATSPSAKVISESFKKAGLKLPKVPRPQRTVVIFQSLKRGIRECIQATEQDVLALRMNDQALAHSTAQAKTIELEKQIRAAERYRKRLEFHLSKIEELEEQYFIHNQLREGVKNMAKAYVSHTGNSKKESLTNVKTGFKECTQIMCAVEAQLQHLMGTFHCQMKGLLGFARLMPGDVYDVSVRHGHQKWKSRGRIGENRQSWQNDKCVFKALLADMFDVKAVEVKLLAKHSLLGQKRCDTKDLFSANPQMMTVSINPHGTIKLSVYVTWNPLEGVDEGINVFDPVQRGSSLKRTNLPVIEGYHFAYLNGEDAASLSGSECSSPASSLVSPSSPDFFRCSLFSSPSSASAHSDLAHLARPRAHPPAAHRPVSVAVMDTISESSAWEASSDFGVVKPDVFDLGPLRDALQADLSRAGGGDADTQGSGGSEGRTLDYVLHSLKSSLEDYQGQYEDLQKLEEQVLALYRMVKGSASRCSSSSRASTGSITIETALEAFDFLESDEYYHDGYGSAKASRQPSLDQLESECTLSPESTTKTADSGIESIANRLSEDQALENSFGLSPEPLSPDPLSTGNEQVDTALLWHLSYCDKLLENLGNFGPLKCREIYSLDRLKRQADIIERLLAIARSGPQVPDLQQVMSEATQSKELRQFWVRCVDGPVLYTPMDRFIGQLDRSYGDLIRERYEINFDTVFEVFLARLLDFPIFDAQIISVHPNITMHQLFTYINDECQCDIRDYFQELAGEVWLSNRLKSGNTDIIIKTMLQFKKEVAPPPDCLRTISLLLIIDNAEVRRSAASYLRSLNVYAEVRKKVLVAYVESLEDKNPDVRSAACIALKLLQGSEAMDQLLYISQSDGSNVVKHMAKETLLSFGEVGRKAYEESQLSSHGFQGLKVHL